MPACDGKHHGQSEPYKMSFVRMVGVMSTLMSFFGAHVLIDRERDDKFKWVLVQLRDTLDKNVSTLCHTKEIH